MEATAVIWIRLVEREAGTDGISWAGKVGVRFLKTAAEKISKNRGGRGTDNNVDGVGILGSRRLGKKNPCGVQ